MTVKKNNYRKYFLACLVVVSLFLGYLFLADSWLVRPAVAADDGLDLWSDPVLNEADFGAEKLNDIGLGRKDPREIATRIIQIALGLLGIIAVALIMYGGYMWMTAQGDADKVDKAKVLLRNATIGLLIILSAFLLTTYILNRLIYSTGGTSANYCLGGQTNQCRPGDCWQSCIDGRWGPCVGQDCASDENNPDQPVYCDGNSLLPGCQADEDACLPYNRYCNTDNDLCLCEPRKGYGESCGAGADEAECNQYNSHCAEYLTCGYDAGDNACICSGPPVIEALSPVGGFCQTEPNTFCQADADCPNNDCNQSWPNGTAGNLMTIHGQNFLEYDAATSRVYFWDGNDFGLSAALANTVNPDCQGAWNDQQIIVVVPDGAASGPIKVVAGNGADVSNVEPGPNLPDFLRNNISRPGICRLQPDSGQQDDTLNYYGLNLRDSAAYFGNWRTNVPANNSTFNTALQGTAQVPNLQTGLTTTFAQSPGLPNSNYVLFRKTAEPTANPLIISIDPLHGPVGQYVTIRGLGFGKSRQDSTVYFGVIEADFAFPDICQKNIWQDNQIVVKVPEGLSNGLFDIKVVARGLEALGPEKFTYNDSEVLSPGLCRLEPTFGQPNQAIQLWGEYFGNQDANSKVRFSVNQDQAGASLLIWGQDKKASGTKPDQATTTIAQAAITGPVKIVKTVQGQEYVSNGLNLTIGQCAQDADCGSGVCCPAGTPEAGRCQSSSDRCFGQTEASVYEWQFSTGNDVTCPPNRPAKCEDNSCCSSLANCVFNTDLNMTTCADDDSCAGYAANLCVDSILCPNSPGQCSQNSKVATKGGSCDCALLGCVDCSYSSKYNRCLANNQTCSLATTAPDIDGDLVKQYCAKYNGAAKWHLATKQTCPSREAPFNNPIKLANGDCVYPNASCDLCSGSLGCLEVDGQGICASQYPVCGNNFQCVDKVCTRTRGLCECCCDKEQNQPDGSNAACCSPLTCAGSCGSSATDPDDSDDQWGYCSGCAQVGNTQAEHDAACNCTGHSGKYCDTSDTQYPSGVCRDCSQIGQPAECSEHSACCVDFPRGNACTGVKESFFTNNNIQYCAYYSCSDNCASPDKSGGYTSAQKCQGDCPISCDADPSTAQCEANPQACPAEKPICNEDCLCVSDGNNPGDSCRDQYGSCSLPCVIGYTCLDQAAKSGPDANGSCRCCCDPDASQDACTEVNKKLFCQPNIEPCTGQERGMCCGCESDNDCGDPNVFGCGKSTCCYARPTVEEVMPVQGQNNVCRNALISAQFSQTMNIGSLAGNIILVGNYGDQLCPDQTALLTELALADQRDSFLAKAWQALKNFLAKWLPGLAGHEAAAADGNNFCVIRGRTVTHSLAEGGKDKTVVDLAIERPLDPGIEYFVIIKGDKLLNSQHGVLSDQNVGLKGQNFTSVSSFNGVSYPNAQIWSFRAGQDICQVEQVAIMPGQHLFQQPFATYPFTARVLAADGQALQRLSGLYSWTWSWQTDNVAVAQVAVDSNNDAAAQVTSGNMEDGQTWLKAKATISEDTISPVATVGREIEGRAKILLFMCANPWPPVTDPNAWPYHWEDNADNCTPGLEGQGCVNNDFAIYYCRDKGGDNTSDDLPSLVLEPAIRGIYDYFGANGMIKIVKEFLFSREDRPFALADGEWSVNNDAAASLGGQVLVSWDDSTSSKGFQYRIYYGTKSNTYNKSVLVQTSPQVIVGLKNKTTYYFSLTLVNDKKVESAFAPEKSLTISDVKAPSAPTNVSAEIDTTNDNRDIKVSWQLSSTDVTKYVVEYGPYESPAIRLNAGFNDSYTIRSLDNIMIQDYYVRLAAVDAADNESSKVNLRCHYCGQERCACQPD